MPHSKFSQEYNAIKTILETEDFVGTLEKPMKELKSFLGAAGPDLTHHAKLDSLRSVTLKLKETDTILQGTGVAAAAPTEKQAKCIAAVKFLRHFYLVGIKGSQTVWVNSTPDDYTRYVHDEVLDAKGSVAAMRGVLSKTAERFDTTTKDRLGEAIILGHAWCQKAETVLSTAKTDAAAKAKVMRWFAPETADFDTVVTKLSDGFKKISALLNGTTLVITDNPPDRSNADKKLTEAYVYNTTETPRTIYVERAMFENYNVSVLHDMKKNWTRILVHECSHIEAKTDDVGGYAHGGIKPVDRVTPANAAKNADSWAFFAADCGGALVQGEITRALGGTGGNLTKEPANWN